MSATPPTAGWVDPSGTYRPGFPPPGFWQASDGRWYPPQSASPSFGPGGPSGPGGPGGPSGHTQQVYTPYVNTGDHPRSKAPVIFLGVLAALVVLIVLTAGLIFALGSDDEGGEIAGGGDTSTTTDASGTSLSTVSTVSGQSADATTVPATVTPGELTETVGCARLDPETIELDLVNSSGETSTYSLTIAFIDASAQRIGDTFAYVNALRPGERTIESVYVFEDGTEAAQCEVIDVDRSATILDAAAMADISACEITGADFIGDVAATVSATNSSDTDADYDVEVAVVDGSGIRHGTGWGYIEHVRPGETAPSDVFTTVDHQDGYVCEVVAANRSAAN
jgi:hypothetical protein